MAPTGKPTRLTDEEWVAAHQGVRLKRPNGRIEYEVIGNIFWKTYGWQHWSQVGVRAHYPDGESDERAMSVIALRLMEVVR